MRKGRVKKAVPISQEVKSQRKTGKEKREKMRNNIIQSKK